MVLAPLGDRVVPLVEVGRREPVAVLREHDEPRALVRVDELGRRVRRLQGGQRVRLERVEIDRLGLAAPAERFPGAAGAANVRE